MENPKLALIPSGYKSGKVYSILPTDGVGDFDYERNGYASRVRKDGLIEELTVDDTPRLDWLNSDCPSLLLEPQRTNNLRYSEDLTNAVWSRLSAGTGINPVVTANYSLSPSGEQNADRIVFNQGSGTGGNDYSIIRQIVSNVGQGISSVYMKSNTSQNYLISIDETGFNNNVTVTPEWQRFEYSESTNDRLQLSLRAQNNSSYADVSVWGAQMEAGSYPTSYIKTTSSTVTRLKDVCINGGDADLFDITEGTFFVDAYAPNSTNSTIISLSNGTDAQKITLLFEAVNSRVRTYSSGGVLYYNNLSYNQRNKILITFKLNEYKTYINGSLVSTDTSATVPTGMFKLNFSHNNGTILHFEGKVHDTRVYDRVLTEAEAVELTTI
jgi:hypothetical protein